MKKRNEQMKINLHVPGIGQNPCSWIKAEDPFYAFTFDFYKKISQLAESMKIDAIFFSDSLALHSQSSGALQMFDPIVLSSMILANTNHIKSIASVSTTFNHPYNIARIFSTLEHMSKGRSGINIITSYNESAANNFGILLPNKEERYKRAEEFIIVMEKLWKSWDKDALVCDKKTKIFADINKINSISHKSNYFNVEGPLNTPHIPTKTGKPIIVQAGSSNYGIKLAAKYADQIYTVHSTLKSAKNFYKKAKNETNLFGRDTNKLSVCPGIYIIFGSSLKEAQEKLKETTELRNINDGLKMLSNQLQIPLKLLELDKEIPLDKIIPDENNVSDGFQKSIIDLIKFKGKTTPRMLLESNLGLSKLFLGTPEEVAEKLEYWFNDYAADGFNITLDLYPNELSYLIDGLIPILQDKNLFKKEYTE